MAPALAEPDAWDSAWGRRQATNQPPWAQSRFGPTRPSDTGDHPLQRATFPDAVNASAVGVGEKQAAGPLRAERGDRHAGSA